MSHAGQWWRGRQSWQLARIAVAEPVLHPPRYVAGFDSLMFPGLLISFKGFNLLITSSSSEMKGRNKLSRPRAMYQHRSQMANSEVISVEESRLLVSGLADFISSTCKVTQELFKKGPQVTIDLINKPCLRNIRDCSRSGCKYCWLVWHGVSTIMRTASSSSGASWESATAFGMVLENDDKLEWLRIGLVASDMDTGKVPREWVDFQWNFDVCHGK